MPTSGRIPIAVSTGDNSSRPCPGCTTTTFFGKDNIGGMRKAGLQEVRSLGLVGNVLIIQLKFFGCNIP